MTRAEILEARRQLQGTRFAFLRAETEKFDMIVNDYDVEYYAALNKLQIECGKIGHSLTTHAGTRCATCDKALL